MARRFSLFFKWVGERAIYADVIVSEGRHDRMTDVVIENASCDTRYASRGGGNARQVKEQVGLVDKSVC